MSGIPAARRHGYCGTPLYGTWKNMRSRCEYPRAVNYRWYGGRGIRVCDAWSDFRAFLDWALANGYVEGLSIDRRDPNGNYEPGNCEWIPRGENTRRANISRKAAPA